MLFGLLPFVLSFSHSKMALISWAGWPGYVPGAEFSILDAFALALYFALPRGDTPVPFRIAMSAYFLATVLSAIQAQMPMAALFYSWQLARMFLIYAVVAKACADPRFAPALLNGMAAGLILEAGVCIWDRFGYGILQTAGTFGHQNLLGLISHLIVFPFFALLLAGQRGWLPPTVLIAGIVVEVLTASRATLGLAGLGYAALYACSAVRQLTPRKVQVLLASVVAISVLVPIVVSSFEQRFGGTVSDYDERAAFEKAATMILSDHPFGVGPNNYVVAVNVGGYNQAAGVALNVGSSGANVHNVYLLVAAESGYLGLITLVLFLLRPLMVAFRCGWRSRDDRRGDVLLGLAVALLVVYIHSFFEWVLVKSDVSYILAMVIGLVAGLATQLGYWRAGYSKSIGASNPSYGKQSAGVAGIGDPRFADRITPRN